MADNDTIITDDFGEYEDWVEIYNPNNMPVDIAGYYLTDDFSIPTLSLIPSGDAATIIPANGFLLLWADSDDDTQGTLHLKFKLSKNGEAIGLYDPSQAVVDTLSFGSQGLDESYGRASDGGTPWIVFTNSTPGASNAPASITDPISGKVIKVYPNPVRETLYFSLPLTAKVFDAQGRKVTHLDKARELKVEGYPKGVYMLVTPKKEYLKFIIN